ncbi:MAG TPA: carbohydrate binding domain-containing protein, partial [Polyangia bacterium]
SQYAMHVQGYYSTYAGIGVWLNKSTFGGSTGVYNASAYTGIKFYARGSGGTLNVQGQMPSTESSTYGGTCTVTSCSGNYYVYPSTLSSTSWTQISVPFSSLTGGTVTPFSPTSTWSFEFLYFSSTSLAGAVFDLWIDDLSFY